MRWSDYLPRGWNKRIGNELNERLKQFIISGGTVLQVKEKFGELRVYTHAPDGIGKGFEYDDLHTICSNTCMHCDKDGTMSSKHGWIGPRCETHMKED